tara:strand:- start:7580 stop:9025 length:1446 start_codon:yes stop_codon:yes gene_type:complete
MSVFDDSKFDYPSTQESRDMAKQFAGRSLQQIATGDPQIFGSMSSSDALAALENGTYRGLEGIDFGMSFGSPVAKLPNGMILDVSPGTIQAALKSREDQRRQILGSVLRDNDRDAYVEQNRESFDGLLSGMIEEGGLSESAAQVYRSQYEQNPAAVLTTLLGFDRTDMRAIKAAEETALRARNDVHGQGVDRRFALLQQENSDMAGQGLSPAAQGRMSTVFGGYQFLHSASNKSADWEQTTDSGEVAQFFAAPVVVGDPKLQQAFSALRQRVSEDPNLSAVDLAESPQFASLVKAVSASAARVAPMSPEYATQVVADLIGAGNAFVEAQQTTMSQRTGKAQVGVEQKGLRAFPPKQVPDYNDDGETNMEDRVIHAAEFVRLQLDAMGINASGMTESEVASRLVEEARGMGDNAMFAQRIMQIVQNRYNVPTFNKAIADLQGRQLRIQQVLNEDTQAEPAPDQTGSLRRKAQQTTNDMEVPK